MAKRYAWVLKTNANNANNAPVVEGELIELIHERSENSYTFYKRSDHGWYKAYEVQWAINARYVEIFIPTELEKAIYDIEV